MDRYLLLYDDNGVVVGASYADVHVELPALWLLIVLAAVAAVVAWANVRLRRLASSSRRLSLVFGGSILFAGIVPDAVRALLCQAERTATGEAVPPAQHRAHPGGLQPRPDHGEPFPAEQDLTFQSLKEDSGTVDNIRLWDWQPLLDTYAQLQEIRTYYRFLDVDVDRYHLDGPISR